MILKERKADKMLYSLDYEIKCPWTIGDNSDYDDLIWDQIFEEDGIVSEESFYEDNIVRDILLEFDSMTDQEYYDKYYGENK